MTGNEKFKFEMMSTEKLGYEMQVAARMIKFHKVMVKKWKYGADKNIHAFHKNELNKQKKLKQHLESIMKKRQLTLF